MGKQEVYVDVMGFRKASTRARLESKTPPVTGEQILINRNLFILGGVI